MAGKVLNLDNILTKDNLGCRIAEQWMTWNSLRANQIASWEELRKYLYATDTTQTTNSKLPWKNKTTIPKLCQTADNLYANYMASLFPKRKWLMWDADDQDSNSKDKRDAITNYITWAIARDQFKTEMGKCVQDYIHYGNGIGTVEWVDERVMNEKTGIKVGYVGPAIRRVSPLDIVFNPTAPSFIESPKIIRSHVSFGEVKAILESENTEDREFWEDLYQYLTDIRAQARDNPGVDVKSVDAFFQMDGFTSFKSYLEGEYVEILTFYGDIFDWETKDFYKNYKIMVVDRHKVISKKPNPSFFGFPPIFHVGWRPRQDNLWAMGPLANLVGLQYRIDHIENLKADVFDLLTFPPLKVKGYVEDFEWGPMTRIYLGDEGDVEMMAPPFQILQANIEIANLLSLIEEMAGAPKEAMGFRTPGEKTAHEVTQLQNAAARIFQSKIMQFEEQFVERLLNAMLELARRNLTSVMSISVFDDEFKMQTFTSLTPEDITGAGKIKPIAARHFAERAEIIQNMNNFYMSGPGQDPEVRNHISSIGIAKITEELLNWQDYGLVSPNVRIHERADAARLQNTSDEQVMMEQQTPSGLTPDDIDPMAAMNE